MSVAMFLYKYLGSPKFHIDSFGDIVYDDPITFMQNLGFDDLQFNTIDLYFKSMKSTYNGRNNLKNLKEYKTQFNYTNCRNYNHAELPVYQYNYLQGWFFKNKFFKRKDTTYICTTKKQMISFLKRYIKLPRDKIKREAILECLKEFVDSWDEERSIFVVSW